MKRLRILSLFAVSLLLTACQQRFESPMPAPEISAPPPVGGPLGPVAQQAPKIDRKTREVRGVWLTNVDSEVLNTKENIERAFAKLAALGFTTVYPVVWNKGYTLYPSPVAERTFGVSVFPNSPFSTPGRDMMAEVIEVAAKHGLEVIPWFESGLKIPKNRAIGDNALHPFHTRKPDWFSNQLNGEKFRSDTIWVSYLTPAKPEVRTFLTELITDLVSRYPVAGIQIDDHFSMWHEFGFDNSMKTLYRQANGKEPPQNARDAQWVKFRAGIISDLIVSIASQVRKNRPGSVISLSSNTFPWSLDNHLQDWPNWIERGAVDEFMLQNYLVQTSRFLEELNKPIVEQMARKTYMGIGLLSGIRTRRVGIPEINLRAAKAREKNYGMAFFFYESLFNLIPPNETPAQREAAFRQLFATPSRPRSGESQ